MRRTVAGLLLLVGATGVAGCARPTGEAITAKPRDPALSGRFFATAGPGESESDLYEATFPPGHLELYRLSDTGRTFGVDGCPSSLTVGVAGKDVDFQDAMRRFDGGAVLPIEGLDDARGALMSVAPDCRVLFLRLDRSTTPPTGRLMVFDPAAKSVHELHAGGPKVSLGIADWGPGGRVAVFEGTAAEENKPTVATGIVIIGSDGSKRTLPSPVAEFGTLQWGASKWIAVGDEANGRTVFLDPDSGARNELAGWFPLAWSPDGQRLMVTDAAERKTLGLVDAAGLTAAREVGSAEKAAFFDLLWLPWDAPAGGATPALGRRPDDGN